MKVCGNCGVTILKNHKTDKDCMLAISREIHSLSSRLVFLLNHLDMDSDISEETKQLKKHFEQMQEFMKLS